MPTTMSPPADTPAPALDYRRPSLHAQRVAEAAEDRALVLRAECDAERTREIAPGTLIARLAIEAAKDARTALEQAVAESDREMHDYWRSRVLTEAQAVAALATVAARVASYSRPDGAPLRPGGAVTAAAGA